MQVFFQDIYALCASLSGGVQGVSEDVWGSRRKMFGWQCDRRLFEAGRKMSRWAPKRLPWKIPDRSNPKVVKKKRQMTSRVAVHKSSMLNGITMCRYIYIYYIMHNIYIYIYYIVHYIIYILDGLFETSASNCRSSNLAGSWFTSAEPFPDFCASERHLTIIHPVTYMIFICTLCISHG